MAAANAGTRYCILLGLLITLQGFHLANTQVDYVTATLRGTVLDPQGSVVAGAVVAVTSRSTGITQRVKTGSDGAYNVPALRSGVYQIRVDAPGFATQVVTEVEFTVGQVLVYDVHMKVGAATEMVEVSADSVPLVQTEQSQQGNTIKLLKIAQLPNISHDFTQQVYTLPGVSNSNSPRSQQPVRLKLQF